MHVAEIFKIVSAVAGLAGIAIIILWLIYKDILKLKIFSKLTKQHTFLILKLIVMLTFITVTLGIVTYIIKGDKKSINTRITTGMYQITEIDPFENSEYLIDGGTQDGIKLGDLLAILGETKKSLTGQDLGRKIVGWVQVTQSQANYSVARLRYLEPGSKVQIGSFLAKKTTPSNLPELPPPPLFGQIIDTRKEKNEYIIDIGLSNGIKKYSLFAILGDPVSKSDFLGSSLGREKIGELLITKTETKWSHGILTTGKDSMISKGTSVRFLSVMNSIQAIDLIKKIRKYEFTINSVPGNADVFLEGSFYGHTPLKLYLNEGDYSVIIKKPGYRREKDIIVITPNTLQKTYKLIDIEATSHELNIWTYPEGAEIYIGNKFQGLTPQKLTLQKGQYEITLKLDGYKHIKDIIEIPKIETYSQDFIKE